MLQVIRPSNQAILAIQEQQDAYYWSRCVDLVLQKHGLSPLSESNLTHSGRYSIVLRDTSFLPDIGFCEGPFTTEFLNRLSLHGEEASVPQLDLFDASRNKIGSLTYGRFLVKRIPESRGEVTVPHEFTNEDTKWRAKDIRFQYFNGVPDGWRILVYTLIGDSFVPVVIASEKWIICGISIFDLFGFNHAMPALSEGFYKTLHGSYQYPLERWLVSKLVEHSNLHGIEIKQKALWPDGCHAALSIRHDYDRPITRQHLDSMLGFYADRNIRATWFLLVDKPPPYDQIQAMLAMGHEVALHTISSSLEDFLQEASKFHELTGVPSYGFTCHGGIGSRGHLALTHNQWAQQAGMRYGEMIGRCRGVPHPIVLRNDEIPSHDTLMVQNCHHSLDLNTKPDGHQLEKLLLDVPKAISEGGHVTIMNHPDIHWHELMTLLDSLMLDGIWRATVAEVVDWLKIHAYS